MHVPRNLFWSLALHQTSLKRFLTIVTNATNFRSYLAFSRPHRIHTGRKLSWMKTTLDESTDQLTSISWNVTSFWEDYCTLLFLPSTRSFRAFCLCVMSFHWLLRCDSEPGSISLSLELLPPFSQFDQATMLPIKSVNTKPQPTISEAPSKMRGFEGYITPRWINIIRVDDMYYNTHTMHM